MSNLELKYQNEHKMRVALEFESEGKLLHAVQLYKSVIDDDPGETEAYFRLAELYLKLDKHKPAITLLHKLLDIRPDELKLRMMISQFFLRCGEWKLVIDTLNPLAPEDDPIILLFTGYAAYHLNDLALARVSFNNFLGYNSSAELKHEAYFYLSRIEFKSGDYNTALFYAKKTDMVYSDSWELHRLYAEIYLKLSMETHAASSIQKAISLNPKEITNYRIAGKIYQKLNEFGKAESFFFKFIEMSDNSTSDDYASLADACLSQEKLEDAIVYYDVSLKLDPSNKAAIDGKEKSVSLLKKRTS